jgi:hypothetical protein
VRGGQRRRWGSLRLLPRPLGFHGDLISVRLRSIWGLG